MLQQRQPNQQNHHPPRPRIVVVAPTMSHRVDQLLAHLRPSAEGSTEGRATAAAATATNNVAASSSPTSSSSADSAPEYDVLIVGLGAMGLSAAYHLAKRGQRVVGLERFQLAHAHGSSHGETRITRLAYWEHPDYVPLLRRSFTLFDELDAESQSSAHGRPLFQQTGSLDIGPEQESIFLGSVQSCRQHGLEHEILTPDQLAQRFPAWSIPAGFKACFQPRGGMLFPERVLEATGHLARKHGAVLRENVEVVDVIPTADGTIEAILASGEVVRAKRVLLAPGAWLPTLLAKSTLGRRSERLRRLATMLKPERQVVTWYGLRKEPLVDARAAASASSPSVPRPRLTQSDAFFTQPAAAAFQPAVHPVWVATWEGHHYYGFPLVAHTEHPDGVKIGRYHHAHEQLASESALNQLDQREAIRPDDRRYTDGFMQRMFRSNAVLADPDQHPTLKSSTCIFTNTPDEHFLVDCLPDSSLPQVSLISACSGHGFKFSSVLGEVLARCMVEGVDAVERDLPIRWLDAGRLLGDRPPLQVLDPNMMMKDKQV